MSKKRVAIVGASGYSGEELVRLLLKHPHVEITAVTSRQSAGQTVAQVFPKFASRPNARSLRFTEPNVETLAKQASIAFLALPQLLARIRTAIITTAMPMMIFHFLRITPRWAKSMQISVQACGIPVLCQVNPQLRPSPSYIRYA